MSQEFLPVILAGGRGERFWPLSRKQRPKQFLNLGPNGESLLQATVARLEAPEIWVVTASEFEAETRSHLAEFTGIQVLSEPEGRDTAAAVAWATLKAIQDGRDPILGFFPADHWIDPVTVFRQNLGQALDLAQSGRIVLLGISPQYPATGYGYFRLETSGRVSGFVEKPAADLAAKLIAGGNYYWNSGILLARASTLASELARQAPEIWQPLSQQGEPAYPNLPRISIDRALLEKTDLLVGLPVQFNWDDLGDWNALERVLRGVSPELRVARHIGVESQGATLYTTGGSDLFVTIGLEDVIIVRDGEVTLIAKKDRTQMIKEVLAKLRQDPGLEHLI